MICLSFEVSTLSFIISCIIKQAVSSQLEDITPQHYTAHNPVSMHRFIKALY